MDRFLQRWKVVLLFGTIFISASIVYAQDHGTSGIRITPITSKIFGNTRNLRILLPPGYDLPENRRRRYPVLYLNDGQNLFDAGTAVFNEAEWGVDETIKRLIETNAIEPVIVVGIDNAGRSDRANEYLPYPDRFLDPPLPHPEGKLYPRFLSEEVMPLVERSYRIKTGRKYTALGGSSYGALIALYSYLKLNKRIGLLLLESPSFYVADAKILFEAERVNRLPERVYLGVGTNEGGGGECDEAAPHPEAVSDVLRLNQHFITKGLMAKNVKMVIEKCARHHEDAWAARFPTAIKFLFPQKVNIRRRCNARNDVCDREADQRNRTSN